MDVKILEVLREVERAGQGTSSFWNVSAMTGTFLNMLVQLTKAQKVLEIGTSNGYSGIYLAEALSHRGGLLYTVESHKERFLLAQQNFEKSGLRTSIRQIFGHAPEVLGELDEPWDMVFLDATKMEYKSYLEVLMAQIKPGGLIIADNAISHGKEMKNYLDFVKGREELQNVLLTLDKGLMMSLKAQ